MRRLLALGAIVLAGCVATPIPIPEGDLGFRTPTADSGLQYAHPDLTAAAPPPPGSKFTPEGRFDCEGSCPWAMADGLGFGVPDAQGGDGPRDGGPATDAVLDGKPAVDAPGDLAPVDAPAPLDVPKPKPGS